MVIIGGVKRYALINWLIYNCGNYTLYTCMMKQSTNHASFHV